VSGHSFRRREGADETNREREASEAQESEQHDLREGDGLAVPEHEYDHGEDCEAESRAFHEEDASEDVAPRSPLPEESR